jgi:hypothetical protein
VIFFLIAGKRKEAKKLYFCYDRLQIHPFEIHHITLLYRREARGGGGAQWAWISSLKGWFT